MAKSSDSYRIADLERQLVDLRAETRRSGDLDARRESQLPCRLAKTVVNPADSTYPTAGSNPDTYPIVFVGATFTQTPGTNPGSYTPRQSAACTVAHNIVENEYVPVGTIVNVWQYQNRWWLERAAGTSPEIVTVQANSVSDSAGDSISPWSQCLWKGKLTTVNEESGGYCSGGFTQTTDVWILSIDSPGGSTDASPTLKVGDRKIGYRVLGSHTVSADTRPLYVVNKGGAGTETQELVPWVLTGTLLAANATALVAGSPVGSPVDNPLALSGNNGAFCVIAVDITGATDPYLLAVPEHTPGGAQMFKGIANASFDSATSPISVGSITSYSSTAPPAGSVNVNNVLAHAGQSGFTIIFVKNTNDGTYDLLNSQKVNMSVVLDVALNGLTLQETKRTIVTMFDPNTAAATTTIFIGTICGGSQHQLPPAIAQQAAQSGYSAGAVNPLSSFYYYGVT